VFAEDLSVFFDLAGHGTAATVGGQAVVGIWENGYADAFDALGLRDPRLTLPTAAAPAATAGTAVVVAGTTYRVASVQPDGTGVTTLLLERA
jgi:hypothetical protein